MKNRERVTWIGLFIFVVVFAGGVALTPHFLYAEQQTSTGEYVDRIKSAFDYILQNYVDKVPPQQLYEGAMKGIFESLDDPYSYYLTRNDMQNMRDTVTGKFGGVGLYISRPVSSEPGNGDRSNDGNGSGENGGDADDPSSLRGAGDEDRDKYIKVIAPIEDTPAYRSGIHAGDYITKVEDTSTAKLSVDEVVNRLRGEPGSDVKVTILRGDDITFDVTITRAIIEIPTVKNAMINGKIGYLRIIQFTPYTSKRVKEALESFREDNYESLVIDVRGNPGGRLSSVIDTVDLFMPKGVIVSTKSRIAHENEVFSAEKEATVVPTDIPVAVLLDEGSASASEILAGAFKDTGRGTLIGQTSFGKGSVQEIKHFAGQSGFKLTISRYYTPSDTNIDKVGIKPDVKVEEEELSEEESESLKHIFENTFIKKFVDENPDASEAEKSEFIDSLMAKEEVTVERRMLEKLLKNEFHRRMDFPPVYDLEYDKALQRAVDLLKKGKIEPNFESFSSPGQKKGEIKAKL